VNFLTFQQASAGQQKLLFFELKVLLPQEDLIILIRKTENLSGSPGRLAFKILIDDQEQKRLK